MANAISFVRERKTTPSAFYFSTSNLTFAFPVLAKPSSCAARRVTSITPGLLRFIRSLINGDDNTLAVVKICHPHLRSEGKCFVRRCEFVLVVNRTAGGLFSL